MVRPRMARIRKRCVIRATPRSGRAAISVPRAARWRANAPSSSNRPIRPANTRQHADAFDDAGIAHLHAHPAVAVKHAGCTHRHDARKLDAGAVRDAPCVAAGGLRQRLQHFGRGGDFRKFLRVGRADIDQRFQRAVGRLPQAEFVGGDASTATFPVRFRSRSVRALPRWEKSPSPARRCRPWSGAAPRDRGPGPAAAALPRRGRAASSASATSAATGRDAARRPHSRAPTARYGRTTATRRGPRHIATAAAAACRRRRSSPAAPVALRVSTVRKNRLQCGGSKPDPSSPRVTGWRLPASLRCA